MTQGLRSVYKVPGPSGIKTSSICNFQVSVMGTVAVASGICSVFRHFSPRQAYLEASVFRTSQQMCG